MELQRSEPLPPLRAIGTDGKPHDVNAEHQGRNLLLYVMPPKDPHTSVVEAESFDAHRDTLERLETDLVGITMLGPRREQRFEDQYGLRHQVLIDDDNQVAKALGAWDEQEKQVVPTAVLVARDGRVDMVVHERDPARLKDTADRLVQRLVEVAGADPTAAPETDLAQEDLGATTMTRPQPGQDAPAFHEQDQNRNGWSLGDFEGHWLVLYFYPKDNTPGCTTEACSFRDAYERYTEADIKIVGVSPDPHDAHSRFVDEYDLPFTLLADTQHLMADAYGVWTDGGFARTTFVIDPKGQIRKVYTDVDPEQHADRVLTDIRELQV